MEESTLCLNKEIKTVSTHVEQHVEQLWLVTVKCSYMYAVLCHSSAVSRCSFTLKSGVATRTDSPVGFGVVYHTWLLCGVLPYKTLGTGD